MDLPIKVGVDLTLYAAVEITKEICDGIADQYPELWDRIKDDPEEIARSMVFASIGSNIYYSNEDFEDWWDGVGNMQGLITGVEVV